MMNQPCRFCKVLFDAKVPDNHVCDGCKEEMGKLIENDQAIRFQFLEKVIADPVCIERIAKAVFSVPVNQVGIGGNGSVAEFFRRRVNPSN